MELIVITRADLFDHEAEAITSLFRHGLRRLHLRKPEATEAEVENILQGIPEAYHPRIVLHQHFELVRRYHVGGLHLNHRHPEPPTDYNGPLSRSCHTLDEVQRYKEQCAYVFLSPIFDSISKQGYASAFSLDDLRRASDLIDSRVIALGGIDDTRLDTVRTLGFGGVAVLGDVWKHTAGDLVMHFQHLLRQTQGTAPIVLTIAGSDPSGGAGIQADLKTMTSLGTYGASVITAITAQNTLGVQSVHPLPPEAVTAQLHSVLADLRTDAVKIGMVHDAQVVQAIADAIEDINGPIVYDPVMISTSGHRLMAPEAIEAVRKHLLPRCTLLTPNLHEARLLAGKTIQTPDEMRQAAYDLSERYGCAVLVKGGHLDGGQMCDILCNQGKCSSYDAPRVESRNLHGTGCTLSSAIAAYLALGNPMEAAVGCAKEYVHRAIIEASQLQIDHGQGPLWHFFS